MSKKSLNPISIRLTDEISEKFRRYSQNYAKSQGEFIEIMLKRFDDTKDLYPAVNNESESERNIWVYTSYLNLFIGDKDKQYRTMKKYLVLGRSEFYYPDTNVHLPFSEGYYSCSNELRKEFNIQDDISQCKFCYWFWILWDKNVEKYLLLEKFSLTESNEKNEDLLKLYIDRCRHFTVMKDIRSQILKFSLPQHLMQFDRQYAETITPEQLENYWK